jgi:hypothetical protein
VNGSSAFSTRGLFLRVNFIGKPFDRKVFPPTVPESSSVVPRHQSSSARRPRSPVRRECRRGAGLPRLDFRPLQGGLNGGVAQDRCSGTTSHGGARSGPGAAAVRRGAWCGRGWGATSDPPPAAPSVREKWKISEKRWQPSDGALTLDTGPQVTWWLAEGTLPNHVTAAGGPAGRPSGWRTIHTKFIAPLVAGRQRRRVYGASHMRAALDGCIASCAVCAPN